MFHAHDPLFTALEKSGHFLGLQIALGGCEPRMLNSGDTVGFDFSSCSRQYDRDPERISGEVTVSPFGGTLQVSVYRCPANRWFRALGVLGTVGAAGGDQHPVTPGAPEWRWRPAGQGMIAGSLGGELDLADGITVTTRIEGHAHSGCTKAAFGVNPTARQHCEWAWAYGIRCLGVLITGDSTFDAETVGAQRIRDAIHRVTSATH